MRDVMLAPPPEKHRFYGTLGLTVAGETHILATDGNTFTDSFSADQDDYDINATVDTTYAYRKFAYLFSYNTILRDKQRPSDTTHDCGSLSIYWYFPTSCNPRGTKSIASP
jgi:hypothetical protein